MVISCMAVMSGNFCSQVLFSTIEHPFYGIKTLKYNPFYATFKCRHLSEKCSFLNSVLPVQCLNKITISL